MYDPDASNYSITWMIYPLWSKKDVTDVPYNMSSGVSSLLGHGSGCCFRPGAPCECMLHMNRS